MIIDSNLQKNKKSRFQQVQEEVFVFLGTIPPPAKFKAYT
jgi:hypothetical protein